MSTSLTPGAAPEVPLFFRMVRDEVSGEAGRRLLAAVVMTAGLAWLSVAIQRGLSGPDVTRTAKMKGAHAVKGFADARCEFWSGVSARAATYYQQAKL